MKDMILKYSTLILLSLFLIVAPYYDYTAYSQVAPLLPPIASTPCDTLYYESLSARAWMEAQRELVQNQNIIVKPDSVLEYTCFDQFLSELSVHASNMLSQSGTFGGVVVDMRSALSNLIITSLRAYGVGNFGHDADIMYSYDLLGGHSAGVGIHHKFPKASDFEADKHATYSCNIMQTVWNAAKCIDFGANLTVGVPAGGKSTDAFFTFQEYADATLLDNMYDKRHRPYACNATAASMLAYKTKWSANLIAAYITPPYTEDPVVTYLANIAAPDCVGSPCPCSTGPIPTGVSVTRTIIAPLTYDDKICVQPGCRYNPPTGDVDGNGAADAEGCYAR